MSCALVGSSSAAQAACSMPAARRQHAACVPSRSAAGHGAARLSVRAQAGGGPGEFFRNFFDWTPETFGPKSTRIWRQNQYPNQEPRDEATTSSPEPAAASPSSSGDAAAQPQQPGQPQGKPPRVDASLDSLQERISSMPASSRPSLDDTEGDFMLPPVNRSFSEAGDDELTAALNKRIGQIATTTAPYDSVVTEEEMRQPLTGQELRQLVFDKYGKSYDLSMVRRDIPGKAFVALNIMWSHLEQRSFKLTEEQYMEKLDSIAYLLVALGQVDKVRAFLKEPARSQKGLPARPVVGTAISVRLDLDQALIDEWFGQGYQ